MLNSIHPENVKVSEVVDSLMNPMVKILLKENGIHHIKFFSRTISAGNEGRALVAKTLVPIFDKAVNLLKLALPEALTLKVLFTFNTVLNIISDVGLEHYWPTNIKDPKIIGKYLKDCIEGGITFNVDKPASSLG